MRGSKTGGAIALFGAALVWGVAFAAQTSASEHVGSFSFIAGKSSVACLFLALLIAGRYVIGRVRGTVVAPALSSRGAGEPPQTRLRSFLASHSSVILGGIACGVVLFAADNCQQFGITVYPPEAAASGRAGFLTATYVVIVALFARFSGKRLHPAVIVAVVVCLAGMYLLCVPGDFSGIYLGDAVMLAGALFYAAHIVVVGKCSAQDALWLSCVQFATSALISAVCAVVIEHAAPADLLPAIVPILYVGIFSTGLGYTLQTLGQKSVDAAPAAIIMSLESVFAALSGWVLLGEQMGQTEVLGCALVFAAVILAQLPEFLVRSPSKGR